MVILDRRVSIRDDGEKTTVDIDELFMVDNKPVSGALCDEWCGEGRETRLPQRLPTAVPPG